MGFRPIDYNNVRPIQPTRVVNESLPLEVYKDIQKQIVKNCFDTAIANSGTYTITEGVIDAKRTDLDNLKNLATYVEKYSLTEIQVRMHDNTMITVTKARLDEIVQELIDYGLSLYQKKWRLTSEIDAAATKEAVQDIQW